MTYLLLITTFILNLNIISIQQEDGDQILGTWVNEEQTTHIEIYKEGGLYYGKIVWLPATEDPEGNPLVDKNNPDEELRDRELWGLNIMEDFEYKNGEWKGGTFYSPQRGQKISPTLALSGNDTLKIKVKRGLIRRTITWTRL